MDAGLDLGASTLGPDSKRPPGEEIRRASLSVTGNWEEECCQVRSKKRWEEECAFSEYLALFRAGGSSGFPGSGLPVPLLVSISFRLSMIEI